MTYRILGTKKGFEAISKEFLTDACKKKHFKCTEVVFVTVENDSQDDSLFIFLEEI